MTRPTREQTKQVVDVQTLDQNTEWIESLKDLRDALRKEVERLSNLFSEAKEDRDTWEFKSKQWDAATKAKLCHIHECLHNKCAAIRAIRKECCDEPSKSA